MARDEHPIVAELGRPETASETAARKAQSSADHRRRQTVNNLVYSLLATVAVVAVIVLMAPAAKPAPTPNVNYSQIAAQGKGVEPDPLITPKLPKTWKSNSAQLQQETSDQVDEWYIGLITPSNQYIGLAQGFKANDTWLAQHVADSHSIGSTVIHGITWKIYDNRSASRDVGDARYALSTQQGKSTVVLYGTGSMPEFTTLARSVSSQLAADAKDG